MLIFKDRGSKQDQQAAKGEKVRGKGEQASSKQEMLIFKD